MLKVRQVAPHEWEFVYPRIYDELMDEFDEGCEFYHQGEINEAEAVFKMVLTRMPDHLDAIHHLTLVLEKRNLLNEAYDLWEQAVRIGRKAFPQDFEPGRDRLQ